MLITTLLFGKFNICDEIWQSNKVSDEYVERLVNIFSSAQLGYSGLRQTD